MNWFKKHILSHIGANNTPNASTSDVEVDKHTDLLQSNNEETQNISEKTICSDESTMSTETDSISHLKLNKQQLAAATYNGKHLLVLAGAGTGKTRTIIARAIHLISNGVNPNRIKILSFTKKSANEIATRIKIEGSNIPKVKNISGSTFHSWCMELITRYSVEFGLVGYSCIDEDDRESALDISIGNCYKKKSLEVEEIKFKASNISEIYSYAVNTRQNLSTAIKHKIFPYASGETIDKKVERIKESITPIIKQYIEYKRSRRYIDYDDMLSAVATILKQNKELQSFICSQYEHILIDEMQDTNPLQWLLLESFFDKCHLFCVGDDAQSIYGFRGADFKSIHSFVERIPNSQVYKLEENYRSTQEILDLSNWLLDESPLNYNKHLFAHRGVGKKPIMQFVNDDWEEADFITDNILNNVSVNGKSYKNHLILSRSAWHARKIEASCISKKIPYVVYGGTTLMKSAHIRDIISALRILSNYRDELAWMRYLKLWDGIGEVKATRIIEKLLDCNSLKECIKLLKGEKLNSDNIYQLLEKISTYELNPERVIDITVQTLDKILSHRYRKDNWEARKTDFSALKLVASKAENISSFITEYILDPVAELSSVGTNKGENDIVIISTIHSAKGLEAEVCYIINVSPGSYPSSRATIEEDIEEERRCLYVALTRAKDELYLLASTKSNVALRPERVWHRKITDLNDSSNTGYIYETKRKYDKNDQVISTRILYVLNNEPTIKHEMEEVEFLKLYLPGDFEVKEAPYFFNNLPNELITKNIRFSEDGTNFRRPKPRNLNKDYREDYSDGIYFIDFN